MFGFALLGTLAVAAFVAALLAAVAGVRGNEICVNGEFPKARFVSYINGTAADLYPGTIVQIDYSAALVGGKHTCVLYNADADGGRPKGPFIVVLDTMGKLIGRLMTDPVPAGEIFQGVTPLPGEEYNLMISDADTGTSTNDVAAGTTMIVRDGFGTLIATTGSPETEVAVTQEAVNDMSGNRLGWCRWTGY